MNAVRRGILLLLAQVLLVAALYGRLVYDRTTLPRVWARTVPVDPNDPFRGRYVRLWLEAGDSRDSGSTDVVRFAVEGDRLVAFAITDPNGVPVRSTEPGRVVTLDPVAFFIPEDIPDPSIRPAGQELWAEVTVLRQGLPRPLRIELRPATGVTAE